MATLEGARIDLTWQKSSSSRFLPSSSICFLPRPLKSCLTFLHHFYYLQAWKRLPLFVPALPPSGQFGTLYFATAIFYQDCPEQVAPWLPFLADGCQFRRETHSPNSFHREIPANRLNWHWTQVIPKALGSCCPILCFVSHWYKRFRLAGCAPV